MMFPSSVLPLLSSSLGVPSHYISQAEEATKAKQQRTKELIEKKKIPKTGWTDADIEALITSLAAMDSNNFSHNCGVGEREARIASNLVSRRHYGFGHGIGRSGDLMAMQPKAAGSSALNALTGALVLDLLRTCGVRAAQMAFVVPMATGMALALCMAAYRKIRPKSARYVLWSRIDQKSCFKSIAAAGFEPVVIQLKLDRATGELTTDIEAMESKIVELGPENVLCVFATTSCFAPRACDNLPELSKLSSRHYIPLLVNNAYGIQSSKCMFLLEEAKRVSANKGEFDLFVQSTDKNLMVPVGGAIIAGFSKDWVQKVSQTYPGRASSTPTLDVFITLLSLGSEGYLKLTKQRKEHFEQLKTKLGSLANEFGERLLETRRNPISVAMTLNHVGDATAQGGKSVTELGSYLFTRGVSGTRVVTGKERKSIEGTDFIGWGSHSEETESSYLTAAAAIGMTENDIDLFIKRMRKVLEVKSSFKKAGTKIEA